MCGFFIYLSAQWNWIREYKGTKSHQCNLERVWVRRPRALFCPKSGSEGAKEWWQLAPAWSKILHSTAYAQIIIIYKSIFRQRFKDFAFSEVCASFQLFVWTFVQPTKFTSDMSLSEQVWGFNCTATYLNCQWPHIWNIQFSTNGILLLWKTNKSLFCFWLR